MGPLFTKAPAQPVQLEPTRYRPTNLKHAMHESNKVCHSTKREALEEMKRIKREGSGSYADKEKLNVYYDGGWKVGKTGRWTYRWR